EAGEALEGVVGDPGEEIDPGPAAGEHEHRRPSKGEGDVAEGAKPRDPLAVGEDDARAAAEVVAPEAQRALPGPRGEEDVAERHPAVAGDVEGAAVVATDDDRVGEPVRAPDHPLSH